MELQPFLRIVPPCFPLSSLSLLFYYALNYCMCLTPSNTWHCWYAEVICVKIMCFVWNANQFTGVLGWGVICEVNLYFVSTSKSFCICFLIVIKQIKQILTRESNFSLYIKLPVCQWDTLMCLEPGRNLYSIMQCPLKKVGERYSLYIECQTMVVPCNAWPYHFAQPVIQLGWCGGHWRETKQSENSYSSLAGSRRTSMFELLQPKMRINSPLLPPEVKAQRWKKMSATSCFKF